MEKDIRRRLERLRDNLDEMMDRRLPPFGYGIVVPTRRIVIKKRTSWQFLANFAESGKPSDPIRLRPDPWIEPSQNGQFCVLWWGDTDGIQAFQEWSQRLLEFVARHEEVIGEHGIILPDRTPLKIHSRRSTRPDIPKASRKSPRKVELGPLSHYTTALLLLHRIAATDPELSAFIERRLIVNLTTSKAESLRNLPQELRQQDHPLKFYIDETDFAPRFARAVVAHLLGEPVREPRLTVDLEKNTATLDGITYALDHELALILYELLKANGTVVSMPEMQEQHADLKSWAKPHRLIKIRLKNDCPQVYKVIEPLHRKGYRIRQEYLA